MDVNRSDMIKYPQSFSSSLNSRLGTFSFTLTSFVFKGTLFLFVQKKSDFMGFSKPGKVFKDVKIKFMLLWFCEEDVYFVHGVIQPDCPGSSRLALLIFPNNLKVVDPAALSQVRQTEADAAFSVVALPGLERSKPVPTRTTQYHVAHFGLLQSGFSLVLLEGVMGEEEESSCRYNALNSFTSSSTSCAWLQAATASFRSLSASARAPSADSFPFIFPRSPASPRTSLSSRSVFSSFWLISSCSWLTGAVVPLGVDAGEQDNVLFFAALESECVRISSIEAQRFFSAVVRRFPPWGVWAGPVCSHTTATSRGRLWDFPEASAVLAERSPSVFDLGQSWPRWDLSTSTLKVSQPSAP